MTVTGTIIGNFFDEALQEEKGVTLQMGDTFIFDSKKVLSGIELDLYFNEGGQQVEISEDDFEVFARNNKGEEVDLNLGIDGNNLYVSEWASNQFQTITIKYKGWKLIDQDFEILPYYRFTSFIDEFENESWDVWEGQPCVPIKVNHRMISRRGDFLLFASSHYDETGEYIPYVTDEIKVIATTTVTSEELTIDATPTEYPEDVRYYDNNLGGGYRQIKVIFADEKVLDFYNTF